MAVAVGDPAPDFEAQTQSGETVRLRDYAGQYLVLYFYPKAFTPGCTKQTLRFRDNYPDLKELGAEVLGVSLDDPETQCDFGRQYDVTFPLVADDNKQLSRKYGVVRKLLPVDKRVTFVIDPEGKIAAQFHHEFQVNKHLDDVVKFLRQAQPKGQSAAQ